MEEKLEMEEPKFLKDLHKIRRKLSRISTEEYESRQKRTMEIYRKELGHLYIEK